MSAWWYDRTGPRTDDQNVKIVTNAILTELLEEIAVEYPALKGGYSYNEETNKYWLLCCDDVDGFTFDIDERTVSITVLYPDDEYEYLYDQIAITDHTSWLKVRDTIKEILDNDKGYEQLQYAMCRQLSIQINQLQQLIHRLLPEALRLPLDARSVDNWIKQQQNLIDAHQALAPNGDAVSVVAAHFADLNI